MMNSINIDGQSVFPSKVVCIGRNYAKHVAELGNTIPEQMVVFMKPNSSISVELQSHHQERLHYEGEICFLVRNGVYSHIGFGLDLTKRQLQSELKQKQLPWERAKAFDGASVFDCFVELPESADLLRLSLELWIDGIKIQQGCVTEMLFKPEAILADIKQFIALCDNDIVMTGTPEGVGEVRAGAEFIGRIFYEQNLLVESSWIARSLLLFFHK